MSLNTRKGNALMKKLLSAVTSAAMSLSLLTSAFASSFSVSAAGSVPTVQPNTAISDASGVSANKNSSSEVYIGFEKDSYSVNPGDQITAVMNIQADVEIQSLYISMNLDPDAFEIVSVNEWSDAFYLFRHLVQYV